MVRSPSSFFHFVLVNVHSIPTVPLEIHLVSQFDFAVFEMVLATVHFVLATILIHSNSIPPLDAVFLFYSVIRSPGEFSVVVRSSNAVSMVVGLTMYSALRYFDFVLALVRNIPNVPLPIHLWNQFVVGLIDVAV